MTITTSTMVSANSNSTSFTEARIVVVRSVRICTFTAEGSDACNWGSNFLMRSTTLMMFAPGWRWMLTMTAGVRFIHAASRVFSVPSITFATSTEPHRSPVVIGDDNRLILIAATKSWSLAPMV